MSRNFSPSIVSLAAPSPHLSDSKKRSRSSRLRSAHHDAKNCPHVFTCTSKDLPSEARLHGHVATVYMLGIK